MALVATPPDGDAGSVRTTGPPTKPVKNSLHVGNGRQSFPCTLGEHRCRIRVPHATSLRLAASARTAADPDRSMTRTRSGGRRPGRAAARPTGCRAPPGARREPRPVGRLLDPVARRLAHAGPAEPADADAQPAAERPRRLRPDRAAARDRVPARAGAARALPDGPRRAPPHRAGPPPAGVRPRRRRAARGMHRRPRARALLRRGRAEPQPQRRHLRHRPAVVRRADPRAVRRSARRCRRR